MMVSTEEVFAKFLAKIGGTEDSKAHELWIDFVNTLGRGIDEASVEQLKKAYKMHVFYYVKKGIMKRGNYVCLEFSEHRGECEIKVDDAPFFIGDVEEYAAEIDEFFQIALRAVFIEGDIEFSPEYKKKKYMISMWL